MEIAGKAAIVTGASSGIGKDAAIDLARRGARVAICARRADKLDQALHECRKYSPDSRAYPCDLRERRQIHEMAIAAARDLGPIDILVNNAGIGAYHLFLEAPEEEFEEMMRVNYFSAVYCTREVLPSMVERRTGAVVFISSMAGRVANWRHTAYAASKFAMTGLAEALYYEMKPKGVHVAVINPGVIRTELLDKAVGSEHLRRIVEPNLLGTEIVTKAIAKAIEKERFELFAPAHYAILWKLRALMPRTLMRVTQAFVERVVSRPPA